jgi:hypothetical protein
VMWDQEDDCKEEEDGIFQSISTEEEEDSRKEDSSGRSEYNSEWVAAEGSGITLGSIFGEGEALIYEHSSPLTTQRLHGCPRSHLALAREQVLWYTGGIRIIMSRDRRDDLHDKTFCVIEDHESY